MAQYCRYCAFAFEGDCFYCGEFEKVLSDSQMRHSNNCSHYVLSDLGDVVTGRAYKPRKQKKNSEIDYFQLMMEV